MSLSLTNREDIIANSYSLITSTGSVVNILDAVQGSVASSTYTKNEVDANIAAVVGAAPVLLNTLVELSAALNSDANYAGTITTLLAAKAPTASPTFTGTVGGLTKGTVGLTYVDNTSDDSKPVSAATTTQLNLKANLAGATFTGEVAVQASKPVL